MDDISDKLSQLLNDPGGMEKIRRMAQSVLGQDDAPPASSQEPDLSSLMGGLDISRLLPVISQLSCAGEDKRVALLNALRPHLSEERQARLDNAVKIMKLFSVLPLLQESGIFNL